MCCCLGQVSNDVGATLGTHEVDGACVTIKQCLNHTSGLTYGIIHGFTKSRVHPFGELEKREHKRQMQANGLKNPLRPSNTSGDDLAGYC